MITSIDVEAFHKIISTSDLKKKERNLLICLSTKGKKYDRNIIDNKILSSSIKRERGTELYKTKINTSHWN